MNRFPPLAAAPLWLLAAAGAIVPFAGLRGQGARAAWSVGAAALVALLLPALWHLLAERRRALDLPSRTSPAMRLALRAAAVSALVAAGALATTGPRGTWGLVAGAWPWPRGSAPSTAPPAGDRPRPSQQPARDALEALVPADAAVVVSSAGAAPLRQWLARAGGGGGTRLDALAKCGVRVDEAAWLVAGRGADRLIAARVPGAGEDRNLYCIAGVLADAGVRVSVAPDAVTVQGLLGEGPLTFRRRDPQTLVLADAGWQAEVESRAAGQGAGIADGPLRAALARVDRGAPLWAIGELRGAAGAWDLAVDARPARPAGGRWEVRASSVAREGGARADATVSAPPAFAAVLPQGSLADGAAGLFAAVAAAGAGAGAGAGPDAGAGARPDAGGPPARR